MGNPRKINPVSVGLVLLLVVGGFTGWKFGTVYWQKHKVEAAMKSKRFEASRLNRMSDDSGEEALMTGLHNEITGLGVAEEGLEIYFEDEYSRLSVKYQVDVTFPFSVTKRMKFHLKTSIDRKDL